jgi:hypothetical protein
MTAAVRPPETIAPGSIGQKRRGRRVGWFTSAVALMAGTIGITAAPAVSADTPSPALTTQITSNPAHASKAPAAPHVSPRPPAAVLVPKVQHAVTFSHVFTVNVNTDSVDASPGDAVCADAAGKCSLRAAIQEADSLNTAVQVMLPAGTYTLTIGPTGGDDITSGDLNVTDAGGVTLVGTSATVDGTGLGDRLFEVNGAASLDMSGVTLTGGHSGANGGALNLTDTTSAATLHGVTLTGNAADGDGGAVYNEGFLSLTGSTVSGNAAGNTEGGGIDLQGSAEIVNDTITGNTVNASGAAGDAKGGGIYQDGGAATISGSTISNNTAFVGSGDSGEGGGVFVEEETTIDSSTITGNAVTAAPAATDVAALGGGVSNEYGLESISNSVIDSNKASPSGTQDGEGGGIYDDTGTVLTNSKVTNNSITPGNPSTDVSAYGGGIANEGGSEQITNSLIDHNSAVSAGTGEGEGGGVYDGSDVTIAGSTVSNNTAGIQDQSGSGGGSGGGLAEEGDNLLVSSSQVFGNQALGGTVGTFEGSGGGIMADDITSISNSLITNNHADQRGGGMWSDDGQHVTADTISGNTANEGGGIWNKWQMLVENSTVSGNSTSGTNDVGGGILDSIGNSASKVVLSSSTVANNTSDLGSGLSLDFGLTTPHSTGFVLENSIVATNNGSPECNLTGGMLTSLGHNLSSDATCGLVAAGDLPSTDPGLLGLTNNGGPTPTQALVPASPAIDAGSNVNCPATDQRGISRPQGPACDIGAYEVAVQNGYWLVASDGGIFAFGKAGFFGSTGSLHLNKPIVGMAATPDGNGYWLVASDGGIFTFGDANFFGSTGAIRLNQPIVGMAATPDGLGYWLVASDGGIFSFGDAKFFGSTGALHLNKPIVGMSATPDGKGYWLVASDGGIFAFGTAAFAGSTGSIHLNKPIVGMATTPDGQGYWLVASDGGIFTFGTAAFFGSTGAIHLNQPVVGMASTSDGRGYNLVASDGGIFSFGDAGFFGSTGSLHLNKPMVGMADHF